DGQGTNGSANGNNTLALPFNQQTNLGNAFQLITDIGGTTIVEQIAQFDRTSDGFVGYTGTAGDAFTLVSGDAYLVQLKLGVPGVNYIVVGSHNPGKTILFDGQGTNGSANGNNFYAAPYHSTASTAGDLIMELGGTTAIEQIAFLDRTTDGFVGYTGTSGDAFDLDPGRGYIVQLKLGVPNVQFVPSHF
ncbi:MAG TPA: hypothetical protein VD788_15070, partial [Candidatus Polarisedimenticolaceae bacterium]|nr:hypothetical protein [Candidatus Polarisedimenticolaceae bacterium]